MIVIIIAQKCTCHSLIIWLQKNHLQNIFHLKICQNSKPWPIKINKLFFWLLFNYYHFMAVSILNFPFFHSFYQLSVELFFMVKIFSTFSIFLFFYFSINLTFLLLFYCINSDVLWLIFIVFSILFSVHFHTCFRTIKNFYIFATFFVALSFDFSIFEFSPYLKNFFKHFFPPKILIKI